MRTSVSFVIILLLILPVIPISSQSDPINVITGFEVPSIDGIIGQFDLGTNRLDEWGDAKVEIKEFTSQQGEIFDVTFKSKFVGGRLFIAFQSAYDQLVNSLDRAILQVDLDGDNKLSQGDVRLISTGNLVVYEIYYQNGWKDGAVLGAEISSMFIGEIGLFLTSRTSQYTQNQGSHLEGELSFDLTKAINYIKLLDIEIGDLEPGEIGFGLQFRTIDEENYYERGIETTVSGQDLSLNQYDQYQYHLDFSDRFSTDVGIDNIILSQSVQYENNSLSLVRNKETLARVFISNPTDEPIPVRVHLYSYNLTGGIELQGSLTKNFIAPSDYHVAIFDETANFKLPSLWESNHHLYLQARVEPIGKIDLNNDDNEKWVYKELVQTHDLVVYNLPINFGSTTMPNMTSSAHYRNLQMWFEHIYPTNPRFINFGWEMIGPIEIRPFFTREGADRLTNELNRALSELLATRTLAMIFGVAEDNLIPLPDQLFGTTIYPWGSSDPAWYLKNGPRDSFVSFGGSNSDLKGLMMAHEINHNILNNHTGRHAPGCGASGSDPTWEDNGGTSYGQYQEAYGWSPANETIISPRYDFMSYCNYLDQPTAWISPYRWEALIDRFQHWTPGQPIASDLFPTTTLSHIPSLGLDQSSLPTSRFVSGIIHKDGQIELDPSFERPGVAFNSYPVYNPNIHSHYLQVGYSNGSIIQFGIGPNNFLDVEGHEMDLSGFSLTLEDNGQIEEIGLYGGQQSVVFTDSGSFIGVSNNDLSIPAEIYNNVKFDVSWPQNYQNTTTIWAQLRYSPDNINWYLIGQPTIDTSISTIFRNLPGSDNGIFQVQFSDGISTTTVDIEGISVEAPDPKLSLKENRLYREANGYAYPIIYSEERSVGNLVSYTAIGTDQLGREINNYNWEIPELNVYQQGGDQFNFQFRTPGSYTIKVTAFDPDTGKSAVTSISLEIGEGVTISVAEYDEFTTSLDGIHTDDNLGQSEEDQGFLDILSFNPVIMIIPLLTITILRRKLR